MDIHRKTLPNGLRLVHSLDTATAMVAVNTLYRVGSRDERPDRTGFAHLFEHLMFGGTPRVPDYDRHLQQACGDNNAYTTADFTDYYVTLPARNVETALWLESDRMRGLAFTPRSLEVQRKVVAEEFRQNYTNQPYGDLAHLLAAICYPHHPYHWPTIGLDPAHIERATMPQVRQFFARHYRPDNAILTLVGNLSWDDAQALADKWYGDIQPPPAFLPAPGGEAPAPPCHLAAPGSRQPDGRWLHRVERDVPSSLLVVAFRIPPCTHPDFPACDMLSDALANGQSSRLYASLVERQRLFLSIDAYVSPRLGEGLLAVEGVLAGGVDMERAERALWAELDALASQPLPAPEAEKLRNKFEAAAAMQRADYMQRAELLAVHEMRGDARGIDLEVPRYRAVTPARLQRVAQSLLAPSRARVLHYCARPSRSSSV